MSTQDKLAEALLGRIQEAWENHSEDGRVFISMRDAMELCEQVLPAVIQQAHAAEAAQAQARAAESHKGLLIGTTPSGVPYSLHGTKESVTAVSDMLEQVEVSRQLGADQPQSAEPVGFVTAGALLALQTCRNDEYNGTVDFWMRPNESVKANIPLYTHPQPAQDVKDAARYRWLREHHDSTRPDWHIRTPTNDAPAIGALDAAIDAAMAKESGR